jgi:hypothetical protein
MIGLGVAQAGSGQMQIGVKPLAPGLLWWSSLIKCKLNLTQARGGRPQAKVCEQEMPSPTEWKSFI